MQVYAIVSSMCAVFTSVLGLFFFIYSLLQYLKTRRKLKLTQERLKKLRKLDPVDFGFLDMFNVDYDNYEYEFKPQPFHHANEDERLEPYKRAGWGERL